MRNVNRRNNVENEKISAMEVVLNGVEYNKKREMLYRTNENYSVKLHFVKESDNVIKDITSALKELYITENVKKQMGE